MAIKEDTEDQRKVRMDRREALTCMTWAGTGLLWALSGGIPLTTGRIGEASAAPAGQGSFTFLQISDSHVGFNKPANPDALGTLREAIAKIKALPAKPAFMIHTGDISHLSKDEEFDNAGQIIKEAGMPVFYVPGEHDVLDEERGKSYLARYGKNAKGAGWQSFDHNGVHYVGLVNVMDLKAGGLGNLGSEQLEWLKKDVQGLSSSTPMVVFAHIPLWTVYPEWGWGTEDGAKALSMLRKFGSVTVLNGHIHQVMQKVEGNVAFHTARSTAFPQPVPGTAPSPGPMKVPAGELRNYLGTASVTYLENNKPLAIVDMPLAG
jgi:3',5'-cyclic-AMP phosphodiesterase